MEAVDVFWENFILVAAQVIEMFGALIIVFFSIYIFWDFLRNPVKEQSRYERLTLAKRLALGLEFKLAAEILRTVVVRSLEELVILGAVVGLRAILSLLILWEIKSMEEEPAEAEQLPE